MERIGFRQRVRRVGLTGGFCSGKSTVGLILWKLGANLIDADQIVDELLRDALIQKEIEKLIGRQLFDVPDYKKRLASILFQNKRLLTQYCDYLYPKVFEKMQSSELSDKVNVWEVPLLYEAGWDRFMDRVILVVADRENCRKRAMARGFDENDFKRRVALFSPEEEKINQADFVIRNNGDLVSLEAKVNEIWKVITKGEGYD